MSEHQHGFMQRKSTITNLINLVQDVSSELDIGGQMDAVFTDFEKAFDSVDHDILLTKLNKLGFSQKALIFFSSYLSGRTQYVHYLGNSSKEYRVKSGVPQGSNLGPVMFLIASNDLPDCIKHSKCLSYADDFKICRPISSIQDCYLLQSDLNNISQWSNENKINFNVKKCAIMSFTRKKNPTSFPYKLGLYPLQQVSEVNDLGVLIDKGLTFTSHINKVTNEAYRALGFVIRNVKPFKEEKTVITLYNAYVRAKLEYTSVVWTPWCNKYIRLIEGVQKRIARFLHYKMSGTYPFMVPYKLLIQNLNITSLEDRRKINDAKFLYKIVNSVVDNSYFLSLINFHVPRPSARTCTIFKNKKPCTTSHKHSPLYRLCRNHNKAVQCNNNLDFDNSFRKFTSIYATTLTMQS